MSLLKKRNKEPIDGHGSLKKRKRDDENQDEKRDIDEDFIVDKKKLKENEKDLEIEEDGEISSEHSDQEIDLEAFAKFCKENPMKMGDDSESSDEAYSEEDEEESYGENSEEDNGSSEKDEDLSDGEPKMIEK